MNKKRQGNNLALIFLIVPAIFIFYGIKYKLKLPYDQLQFFINTFLYSLVSFILLWIISFWNTELDRVLIGISLFLFGLWFISSLMGVAYFNQHLDTGDPWKKQIKIIRTQKVSGSGRQAGQSSCLAKFNDFVEGVDYLYIRYDYCDIIRPGVDGLLIKFRPGKFGMPWTEEYSVIKDFELYEQRLGRGE